MELENKLLSAAAYSREAYTQADKLGVLNDMSDGAKLVWEELGEFYSFDNQAPACDLSIVSDRLARKYPKHSEMFKVLVSQFEKVSVPNVIEEVVALRELNLRDKLSAAFASGSREQIDILLQEYTSLRQEELNAINKTEVVRGISASELVEGSADGNRVRVLPTALNDVIKGGLLPQHHVVVFAPTDMGKSLFVMNMVSGFLKQKKTVLYCGNEDPMSDMLLRLMIRVTGMNEKSIRMYPGKADKIATAKGWDNLVFAEIAPGTPMEIESLVQEHQPDILIVDQIRNLDMGEKNFVRALEMAAQMMRRLGKTYNLIPISVTQAADSATGKNILTRGDIDNSNIGIPGTADLMIGIGADNETEEQGYRWLSLVKNKVSGRKQPIKVKFDPMRTRVE